jgi:GTP-binding protein Era
VGEKISIAPFKAPPPRHRIMGIVNTPDMQIVFSDTPGVLKPNYKMQEMMLAFSESALADADVLLYVTDVVENPEKNLEFLEKVKQMTIPVLLLINKIDESDQQKLATWWRSGTRCCPMPRSFPSLPRTSLAPTCS